MPFDTKEQRIFKKMGYYSDQDGIHQRFAREAENWNEHLTKTKNFIIHACKNKNCQKAAILGSGWLLDVPLIELCEYFKEVWLFDIRHPAWVRHKIRNLKNVHLVECDITCFAVHIYEAIRNRSKNKEAIAWDLLRPVTDLSLDDFDFIVSCNLLDQLDDIPVEYIRNHGRIDEEAEQILRKKIQQSHLRLLPVSKSCIITDMEELLVDSQEQIVHKKKLVYTSIPDPTHNETWIWKFDRQGRYNPHFQTWFAVEAFEI